MSNVIMAAVAFARWLCGNTIIARNVGGNCGGLAILRTLNNGFVRCSKLRSN